MTCLILALTAVLALPAPGSVSEAAAPPEDQANRGTAQIRESMPSVLGGLAREGGRDYDDPAYGASTTYRGAAGTATLYVYDMGLDDIPEDIDAPVVRAAFESARAELQSAVDLGLYARVDEVSRDDLTFSAIWRHVRFLHAGYEVEVKPADGQPAERHATHIYLTAHRGQFVKLRFSCPADADAKDALEAVLGDISALIAVRDLQVGWVDEAAFRRSEPGIRLLARWLEANPGNPPNPVVVDAMTVVTAWLIGTPYVRLELDAAHLMSLQDGDCECRPFLTAMFTIGCGLHALEAPGADAAAVRLAGTQYMLRAHANLTKAGGGQSGCAALAPLAQANEAGTLSEELRK
jgi:hypothetical protein